MERVRPGRAVSSLVMRTRVRGGAYKVTTHGLRKVAVKVRAKGNQDVTKNPFSRYAR
ncbi:hypothetical protein GCM10022403_088920 [Streptomyces coacervatus]|uniref:Uncharacterized protein n=1 Tax=Streptomyces coacervatus TaxID=647381 RepID=A0ABP7JFL3_9ACTN